MTATTRKPEVMATRKAFDGKGVQFWTDGAVTVGQLATYVRGCGDARDPEAARRNYGEMTGRGWRREEF